MDYKIIDTFKVVPENEGVCSRVGRAVKSADRTKLALVGVSGSGKTHLLHGIAVSPDFSSEKEVVFISAGELAIAARAIESDAITQIGESFLEKIGSCDFLIVDDFDTNISDGTSAAKLFSLMVEERDRRGKPTIVAARAWNLERTDVELGACMSGFEVEAIEPLANDKETLIDAARLLIGLYEPGKCPFITDVALEYIIGAYARSISDVPNMMRFLLEGDVVGPDDFVDEEKARQLFG